MARRRNIMSLDGWDELITKIEKAGLKTDAAAEKCLEKSAAIMQDELKAQMQKSGVSKGLVASMPAYEIEKDRNRFSVRIGYKKGSYNPENPSDGYLVVFLNYGTPNRSKHGKVKARGFITRAKNKAAKPIRAAQEETLHDILKELEK